VVTEANGENGGILMIRMGVIGYGYWGTGASEAEELLDLADKKNLKVMVDHTFLLTGAVRKTKQLIEEDILGNLLYFE
jgi:hypothetical protein